MNPPSDARYAAVVAMIDPRATLVRTREFAGGLSSQMAVVEFVVADGTQHRVVVRGPTRTRIRTLDRGRIPSAACSARARTAYARASVARRITDALGSSVLRARVRRRGTEDARSRDGRGRDRERARGGTGGDPPDRRPPIRVPRPPRVATTSSLRNWRLRRPSPTRRCEKPTRARRSVRTGRPPHHRGSPCCTETSGPATCSGTAPRIAAAIDWENAAVGDPLADVATTRLDLLWAFGPRAMTTFTTHYAALSAVDLSNLPQWDLAATLRPAGAISIWAADWHAYGRPDLTATKMRAIHQQFLDDALATTESRLSARVCAGCRPASRTRARRGARSPRRAPGAPALRRCRRAA